MNRGHVSSAIFRPLVTLDSSDTVPAITIKAQCTPFGSKFEFLVEVLYKTTALTYKRRGITWLERGPWRNMERAEDEAEEEDRHDECLQICRSGVRTFHKMERERSSKIVLTYPELRLFSGSLAQIQSTHFPPALQQRTGHIQAALFSRSYRISQKISASAPCYRNRPKSPRRWSRHGQNAPRLLPVLDAGAKHYQGAVSRRWNEYQLRV